MNCPKCGNLNNENSKFCIRCGNSLVRSQSQTVTQTTVQPNQYATSNINNIANSQKNSEINNQQNINFNQNLNNKQTNPVQNINSSKDKGYFVSYLLIMLSVILKPHTGYEKEKSKFSNIKTSVKTSLIITTFITLVTLISKMLSAVIVKTLDYKTGEFVTEWVFKNLKDLKYIDIIGKNILLYLGIIFAVAGIYYIASLIAKKQGNFSRLVAISSLAIIPFSICSLVLNPIVSIFSIKIGLVVTLIGSLYTFLLMYELINDELKLEGNAKYYFNLICISILGVAGGLLLLNSFTPSIAGDLSNISNLFG